MQGERASPVLQFKWISKDHFSLPLWLRTSFRFHFPYSFAVIYDFQTLIPNPSVIHVSWSLCNRRGIGRAIPPCNICRWTCSVPSAALIKGNTAGLGSFLEMSTVLPASREGWKSRRMWGGGEQDRGSQLQCEVVWFRSGIFTLWILLSESLTKFHNYTSRHPMYNFLQE